LHGKDFMTASSTNPAINKAKRAPKLSPEKRRAQLLDCAVRVAAKRGLSGMRRAEVAQEAGVAVPTVYAYFEDRKSLVNGVLELLDEYLSQIIWQARDPGDSVFQTLLRVSQAFSNSVDRAPEIMQVWLDWSTAFNEDSWPLYEDLQRRVSDYFCHIIEAGQKTGEVAPAVNPEIAAYLIIGGGHMMVQMKLAPQPAVNIDNFLETLVASALSHPPLPAYET
jgi:TetR/AcrR family hemagglutinin/protease transcriptional regulator